jgi:hypothetical protein
MPPKKYATNEERREAKLQSQRKYRAQKRARVAGTAAPQTVTRAPINNRARKALGNFGKLPPSVLRMIANRVQTSYLVSMENRDADLKTFETALRGKFSRNVKPRTERLLQTAMLGSGNYDYRNDMTDYLSFTPDVNIPGIGKNIAKKLVSESPPINVTMSLMSMRSPLTEMLDKVFNFVLSAQGPANKTLGNLLEVFRRETGTLLEDMYILTKASRPMPVNTAVRSRFPPDDPELAPRVLMAMGYRYHAGNPSHVPKNVRSDQDLTIRIVQEMSMKTVAAPLLAVHTYETMLDVVVFTTAFHEKPITRSMGHELVVPHRSQKPLDAYRALRITTLNAEKRAHIQRAVLELLKSYATLVPPTNNTRAGVVERLKANTHGADLLQKFLRIIMKLNDERLVRWYIGKVAQLNLSAEPKSWYKYATSRRLFRSALGVLREGHPIQDANTLPDRAGVNYESNYGSNRNANANINNFASTMRRRGLHPNKAALIAELRSRGIDTDEKVWKWINYAAERW